MKLRFTSSLFILLFFSFLFLSNSGGRASIFGEGNTGAPGDDSKTCGSCHGGGNFGADIEIKMFDLTGNEVTEYLGGETYTVQARVTTTSAASGYGLQMVSLLDDSETDTNGFSNPSDNAQIISAGGRNYLEQKVLSSSDIFTTEWTAPAAGGGSVSFYAAGHASNANGSISGDDPAQGSTTFQELAVSTTAALELNISVYPNPVDNFATISWNQQKNVAIALYDVTGQVVVLNNVLGTQTTVDMSTLNAGVYFLSIIDNDSNAKTIEKIVKR